VPVAPQKGAAGIYSVLLAVIFLAVWQASVAGNKPGKGVPGPAAVAQTAVEMLSNPFYDNGPNDKGIGLQFLSSLGRLAIGYVSASLIAILLDVVLGLSPTLYLARSTRTSRS
jgi:nitrate/nitrite transport system permease protein